MGLQHDAVPVRHVVGMHGARPVWLQSPGIDGAPTSQDLPINVDAPHQAIIENLGGLAVIESDAVVQCQPRAGAPFVLHVTRVGGNTEMDRAVVGRKPSKLDGKPSRAEASDAPVTPGFCGSR